MNTVDKCTRKISICCPRYDDRLTQIELCKTVWYVKHRIALGEIPFKIIQYKLSSNTRNDKNSIQKMHSNIL